MTLRAAVCILPEETPARAWGRSLIAAAAILAGQACTTHQAASDGPLARAEDAQERAVALDSPNAAPLASGTYRGDLHPVSARFAGDSWWSISALLVGGGAEATMVCEPSFSPQYAVALVRTEDPSTGTEDFPGLTWSLEVRVANRILKGTNSDFERRESRVTIHKMPVDAEDAAVIAGAWRAVVRRTRYPSPQYCYSPDGTRYEVGVHAVDGTMYRFRSRQFEGEAHSPTGGFAADLVELANGLRAAAEASPEDRATALKSCVHLARRIRQEVESAPW